MSTAAIRHAIKAHYCRHKYGEISDETADAQKELVRLCAEAIEAHVKLYDNVPLVKKINLTPAQEAMLRQPCGLVVIQEDDSYRISQLIFDIGAIRHVAGDLDIGYVGKRMRGNIGPIVTRACDRIEKYLREKQS